jgi:hypothetical protein
MNTMDAVLRNWLAEGVQVNPGASETELARLEAFVGVVLPQDVRAYFAAANGMSGDRATNGLTSFWPIERIVGEPQLNAGMDEIGEFRDIAFADVMLDASLIWLRVRGSRISIFVEVVGLELPSLEDFFERYLTDPTALRL